MFASQSQYDRFLTDRYLILLKCESWKGLAVSLSAHVFYYTDVCVGLCVTRANMSASDETGLKAGRSLKTSLTVETKNARNFIDKTVKFRGIIG